MSQDEGFEAIPIAAEGDQSTGKPRPFGLLEEFNRGPVNEAAAKSSTKLGTERPAESAKPAASVAKSSKVLLPALRPCLPILLVAGYNEALV